MTELEKQYLEALKTAEEIGAQLVAHGHTSSRENSLSYTNLQQSVLWHEKHVREVQYRQSAAERADS